VIIGTVLWVLCGVVAAGIFVAYFQGKFFLIADKRFRSDLAFSLGIGLLCGPAALLVAVFWSEFLKHGWRLWRK